MSTYKEYTLKDLKELAKELKISGIHKLDKDSLIKEIEKAQGIKSKPAKEEKTSEAKVETEIEVDEILEKNIEEFLKQEEISKSDVKEEIIEEKKTEISASTIDLSAEEEIIDAESLIKELSDVKVSNEINNDPIVPEAITEEQIITPEDSDDSEVIKPAYQANMLVNLILAEIPKALYYEVISENNLNEDELRNLLSRELQDGEPYDETKKNLFVTDFVSNFKDEVKRLVKIKSIKKVELSTQHKKWLDYLKIYKLTPADLLKRYPNHKQKEILEDLIRYEEQQGK